MNRRKEYFLKAFAEIVAEKSFFEFFPLLCEREVRAIQSGEILPDEFFNESVKTHKAIDIGGTIYEGIDDIPSVVDLRHPKAGKPKRHKGNWFDLIA